MAVPYILTGHPCSGKTTLAAWLCRRLPQPVAGLRTLCIGRCEAGPLFSMQDLTTGRMVPISREENGRVCGIPRTFETFGTEVLQAAINRNARTVLVDEVGRFERNCTGYLDMLTELLAGPRTVVLTVKREDLPHLNALRAWPGAVQIDLDAESPETVRARLAQTLPASLHPGVSVRLFREEKCFGPGPLQLLELVGRTGSLHKAAAAMGMAYSKAWKMLGNLEAQWGFAMVERKGGGAGGGGCLLTPRAWDLLARYRAVQWAGEHAAHEEFARQFAEF